MNKMCPTGKVEYATEGKAQAAIRSITSRGGIRRARARTGSLSRRLNTYRCTQCDSWHVGSA